MLTYPNISPVAVKLGPLSIRWYSLAYIAGILGGWWYGGKMNARAKFMNQMQFDAILTWIVGGIIFGGRLGYVIFYKTEYYLHNPIEILYLWEGGMSFHGGMIGMVTAFYIFCKRHNLEFFRVMDVGACVAPIGLFFGRVANFINGELYGRVTDSPIAMIFPHSDGQLRYPSQLIEATLEGIALFSVLSALFWVGNKWRQPAFLSGVFLIFYAFSRIISECFREPDVQLGYLFGGLTMGQILSIPMIILGIYLVIRANKYVGSEATYNSGN